MRLGVSKINTLGARHPGLVRKVDAMFAAFASIDEVSAMIRAEFGERISHTTVWKYKKNFWSVCRDRVLRDRAMQAALEEFVQEGRN